MLVWWIGTQTTTTFSAPPRKQGSWFGWPGAGATDSEVQISRVQVRLMRQMSALWKHAQNLASVGFGSLNLFVDKMCVV